MIVVSQKSKEIEETALIYGDGEATMDAVSHVQRGSPERRRFGELEHGASNPRPGTEDSCPF